MVDERGLPDTNPGNYCNDIYILVCPCIIQESDILLSIENIDSRNGQSELLKSFLVPVLLAACEVTA